MRRRQRERLQLHFSALTEEDRSVCEGIPLTTLSRTLLDLAATFELRRLERAIERSEELRLFDLRAVDELLSRAGRHPGAGRLRQALDIYRDQPAFTRSKLEAQFLDLVKEAGLPVPAMNFCEGEFELDAYWQRERFAVELDVYKTHGSRVAFESDRLRQEDLKLRGIEMVRVTGARLDREPHAVIERVEALLRQRRLQLGLEAGVDRGLTASSGSAGG